MSTNGSRRQDDRNQKASNGSKLNPKGDQMTTVTSIHKSRANDNNSEQGGSSATMNPKPTAQESPYNKYAGTTNLSAAEQQEELPGRGAKETSSNTLENALDRNSYLNTSVYSQKKKKDIDEHQKANAQTNRVKETIGEIVKLGGYEEMSFEPYVGFIVVNNCKDGNTEGNPSSIVCSTSSVVEKPNEEVTTSNEKSQGDYKLDKDASNVITRYTPLYAREPVRPTIKPSYTRLISTLAKPLAEMAKNHLINMRHTEDYMQQIRELDKNKSEVQGQLRRRMTVFVPLKLKKPRTVCRSQNCTKYLREYNYAKEHRVCHDNCDQACVPVEHAGYFKTVGSYLQATCRVCGCHSHWHIHEFYKNVEQEHTITDNRAQVELHNLADRKTLVNLMLEEEKEKYKALEFEHNTIRDFCAEAAVFLLENSILAGGDPFLVEIEILIKDEENKSKIGGDSQMLYELMTLKMQYQERVAALQEDIKGNRRAPLTSELMNMMDKLSVQKMCGEQIKQLKNLCEEYIHEYEM